MIEAPPTAPPRQLEDEDGNLHTLGERLGSGGQGDVFRTQDFDLAIKLAKTADGTPPNVEAFRRQVLAVRLLPIPERLPLAMPQVVLKREAGYVMSLLDGMVPFASFFPLEGDTAPPGTPIPSWLAGMEPADASRIVHYQNTGGLRRRLLALAQTAGILARLHAAGLVYGDVSPHNAFISSHADSRKVWLIDADNLCFDREPCHRAIFTPNYGAPEVVQGRDGGHTRTDCHAFAAMAFWMLTLAHPFVGSAVENPPAGGGGWSEEPTEPTDDAPPLNAHDQAMAGLFPWIDDENDDSNASSSGLPRPLVLTPELSRLFQETFGPGRLAPWRRPAMFHWPVALARALDDTVRCSGCGMSSYGESEHTRDGCPYCHALAPSCIRAAMFIGADPPREAIPSWVYTREWSPGQRHVFPRRLLHPFRVADTDADGLTVEPRDGEWLVRREDTVETERLPMFLRLPGNRSERYELRALVRLPAKPAVRSFRLEVGGAAPRTIDFSFPDGENNP